VRSAADDQHRQSRGEQKSLGQAPREHVLRWMLMVVAYYDEVRAVLVRKMQQIGDDVITVDRPKLDPERLGLVVGAELVSLHEQFVHGCGAW
jgi:hypothetical protein